jgi:hypothetical protein
MPTLGYENADDPRYLQQRRAATTRCGSHSRRARLADALEHLRVRALRGKVFDCPLKLAASQ